MTVLGISVDALSLPNRVSLAKIDAEGHETEIIHGMRQTIERDLPVLIVEDNGQPMPEFLAGIGYRSTRIQSNSPNVILIPAAAT